MRGGADSYNLERPGLIQGQHCFENIGIGIGFVTLANCSRGDVDPHEPSEGRNVGRELSEPAEQRRISVFHAADDKKSLLVHVPTRTNATDVRWSDGITPAGRGRGIDGFEEKGAPRR